MLLIGLGLGSALAHGIGVAASYLARQDEQTVAARQIAGLAVTADIGIPGCPERGPFGSSRCW
jgi:hypothetical protein